MEWFGEWFLNLGWGAIIVSVLLGAVISYLISLHFTASRKPRWESESTVLFDAGISSIKDLDITYKGGKVNDLTSTRIFFWNAGKRAIKKDDVNETIAFVVPDAYEIYSAEIVKMSKYYNRASCEISDDRKKVYLSFETLEENQGIQLQIYNNCKKETQLSAEGDVSETSIINGAYADTVNCLLIFICLVSLMVLVIVVDNFSGFSKNHDIFSVFVSLIIFLIFGIVTAYWYSMCMEINKHGSYSNPLKRKFKHSKEDKKNRKDS